MQQKNTDLPGDNWLPHRGHDNMCDDSDERLEAEEELVHLADDPVARDRAGNGRDDYHCGGPPLFVPFLRGLCCCILLPLPAHCLDLWDLPSSVRHFDAPAEDFEDSLLFPVDRHEVRLPCGSLSLRESPVHCERCSKRQGRPYSHKVLFHERSSYDQSPAVHFPPSALRFAVPSRLRLRRSSPAASRALLTVAEFPP